MAIIVEREDLHLGGAYDQGFLETHVCGECGGGLSAAWHGFLGEPGQWWLRCSQDWSHSSFEKQASWTEAYRRGENGPQELLKGPLPGRKPMVEDTERLAEGQRQMEAILAEHRASGRTADDDYRDLFGE